MHVDAVMVQLLALNTAVIMGGYLLQTVRKTDLQPTERRGL